MENKSNYTEDKVEVGRCRKIKRSDVGADRGK